MHEEISLRSNIATRDGLIVLAGGSCAPGSSFNQINNGGNKKGASQREEIEKSRVGMLVTKKR
jgi:hypothetical protein